MQVWILVQTLTPLVPSFLPRLFTLRKGNMGLYAHRNHEDLLGSGNLEGRGLERIHLSPTHHAVTTRMTALRWAAVLTILMFHYLWGQSHNAVPKPQFLKRKDSQIRQKTDVHWFVYPLGTLPLGQTGLLHSVWWAQCLILQVRPQ